MKLLSLFAFVAVLGIVSCKHSGGNSSPVSKADIYFLQKASYSNLAEITAGGIAAIRGSYDSVTMFGTMMVQDHSKAQKSLESLASSLNVTVPQTPDSAHRAKAAMLSNLSGHQFDTAYINAQVIDHEATIAVFQQELSGGENTQVKNFATQNLPVIQMHLQEALSIQSKLK